MPLFGSHLSIAGGYYRAAQAAGALGLDTLQIFTKNNNQWAAKPLTAEDVAAFQREVNAAGLQQVCSHDSYLINLASPQEELWQKSLAAFIVELERAAALGLAGVVMHPGSHVDSSEAEGLARAAAGIQQAIDATRSLSVQVWIETTAGQGTNLGHRFEHLSELLQTIDRPERLGICVDTCHVVAAGYPLSSAGDYQATIATFDEIVGLDWVRAFHLNDSQKPLGSRVDRHEHIGEGYLGDEAFRLLINDRRFAKLPMYLETKKEQRDGEEMDAVNLRRLKGLLKATPRTKGK